MAGSISLATLGVRNAQSASRRTMALPGSRRRSFASGTQMQPPRVSGVRTSMSETSNVREAKWKTRDDASCLVAAARARELLQNARCEMTTPLGTPVEPEVKRIQAVLVGLCGGGTPLGRRAGGEAGEVSRDPPQHRFQQGWTVAPHARGCRL